MLCDEFDCRWGAPARLLSNQGCEFMAEVNKKVCRKFNIKRSVTSAYDPQTNRLDERTNQTLKVHLSKLVNDQQNDWDQYLEQVAFSIRTQKQCSTKHAPFYLMFGRNPRSPLEVCYYYCCCCCNPQSPLEGYYYVAVVVVFVIIIRTRYVL